MPRKKKESRRYIDLREGCYCTELKVIPSNWDVAGASIRRDWQIWYRFFDPRLCKQGRLVSIRGMNHVHTLAERRDLVPALIRTEEDKLHKGWHPVEHRYMVDAVQEQAPDYIIPPDTPLCTALQQALDRLCSDDRKTRPEMKIQLRSCLKYFKQAAVAAGQHNRPVSEVKRRHMLMCWEELAKVKKELWSANAHNYYRSYISILFRELYQIETIEVIPMGSIMKREIEKSTRATLSDEQRTEIDERLKADNYRFWRVMHLFFHSGARTTELLNLKDSDVDFTTLLIRYEVYKGRTGRKRIVCRPMKDLCVEMWREVVAEAQPGQYLFAKGLVPGDVKIRSEQISRRWRKWVKDRYGINIDWYPLKHLNATEVRQELGTGAAMAYTGHTTSKMLDEVYDVKLAAREAERVRKARNTFAPAVRVHE